jgi:hypothetical protein
LSYFLNVSNIDQPAPLNLSYKELTLYSHCCLGSHSNFVPTCFSSISNSLRSLDLSYNELTCQPEAVLALTLTLPYLFQLNIEQLALARPELQ